MSMRVEPKRRLTVLELRSRRTELARESRSAEAKPRIEGRLSLSAFWDAVDSVDDPHERP